MQAPESARPLRLALPKGRTFEGVSELFRAAGLPLRAATRAYRPQLPVPGFETKLLKPRAVVEMLIAGSRDLGFVGADWVAELDGELVELLDTGLDPVRLVAAIPSELAAREDWRQSVRVVGSEYVALTQRWIEERGLNARCLRSWGATEVLPPEDADAIVDNTSTGATLAANGLQIVDELMRSTTRLYVRPAVLEQPWARRQIDELVLLLRSVLDARERVLLELNVSPEDLEQLCEGLPCMQRPTVSELFGASGYAVRAAVPRSSLATLIPDLKARGGRDLLVTSPGQIVL